MKEENPVIYWPQESQCLEAQYLKAVDFAPLYSLSLGYAYPCVLASFPL